MVTNIKINENLIKIITNFNKFIRVLSSTKKRHRYPLISKINLSLNKIIKKNQINDKILKFKNNKLSNQNLRIKLRKNNKIIINYKSETKNIFVKLINN